MFSILATLIGASVGYLFSNQNTTESKRFYKNGGFVNIDLSKKVIDFAKQFIEQQRFYRVIDSSELSTDIKYVDSLSDAKYLLKDIENEISDDYDMRYIEEYRMSNTTDFDDIANNFLENNYFESVDEITYDDVRDYLLDNQYLLTIDESSYTEIGMEFYIKQGDLDEKLSEQTNIYIIDLINDFAEHFKDFIHYEEFAGYMQGSYYATLLMSPDGSLIKNDKILYKVEKYDYEKTDYNITGNKIDLGVRTSRIRQNIDESNAIIQIRISDHNKVYTADADAFLSIVIKPEFQYAVPYSQDELRRGGERYSELPIPYKINTEYKAAYNVEGSILDVSDIKEWLNDLSYKELIENRND